MMRKKRILMNSEYSQHKSGYARLANEILKRLHKSNKYDLCELASYASPSDPSIYTLDWVVYPVRPADNDENGTREYDSHPHNQLGRHKFNHAVLDFEPDVVLDFRDYWYKHYEHISPFRRFYNLIWGQPCDSLPQTAEWIDDTIDCDACVPYTDFGYQTLKAQCGNKGNILPPVRLCADSKTFFPMWNKKGIKAHFNFDDSDLIVGFVARNQYRKLFDDVFQAFTSFLIHAPAELTQRTYLYIHSGWPDIHIDFAQILNEYGITNKVLFTYLCKNCHNIFPSSYSDVICACKYCGGPASLPTPTDSPLGEDKLNLIYNFFDLYVANFTNEGIGLPPLEAMFCGVPTAVTNFSGAEDLINLCGAIPLDCHKLKRESEFHRLFAVPDNTDLANKLYEILSLPDMIRRKMGFEQYQKAIKHFNWDNEVIKLESVIDKLPYKDWKTEAPRLIQPDFNIPDNLSNEQYVHWLYAKIVGRPELFHKYHGLKKIYDLTMGFHGDKPGPYQKYDREQALEWAKNEYQFYQHWELSRANKYNLMQE